MDVREFSKLPILGILRGVKEEAIEPLINEAVLAGLKAIEVAMNTDDAKKVLKRAARVAKGRINVGAGTIINRNILTEALDCGATFIVSPVLVNEVIDYCVKNKIPVFPGALTPQEIYNAWQKGATMVKVFPAYVFGPQYFKEVKAPLNNIKLLACGGVRENNVKDYFDNGASAVAFGASIFRSDWIKEEKFKEMGIAIKDLIKASNL